MEMQRLQPVLSRLSDPAIKNRTYLVKVKNEPHEVDAAIVAHLTSIAKMDGVHITLVLPSKALCKKLEEAGADLSKLHIIDASGSERAHDAQEERVTHTGGPTSLTELSIAITKQMNVKPYGFFFFETASAVAASNPPETVERFFRYLFNKMEERETLFILIACPGEKIERVLPTLTEFADKYIEIE